MGEVLDTTRKLEASSTAVVVATRDTAFIGGERGSRGLTRPRAHLRIGAARQVIAQPREERTRQLLQYVLDR